MKKETCRTCSHHTEVEITGFYDEEGDPIPMANHYCDGAPLDRRTVDSFRCGRYKEGKQ